MRSHTRRLVTSILVLVIALIAIAPIVRMVIISIMPMVAVAAYPPVLFPSNPTLAAYVHVFVSASFGAYLINSLIAAGSSTVISVVIGAPLAYVLAFGKLKRRDDIAFWVLSTWMIPPIAIIIPLFLLFRAVGILDHRLGLIIAYVVMNLPLVVWLTYNHCRSLPVELDEAGKVDGATEVQRFRHVILPLLVPGIVSAGLLAFIFAWNEFLFALVMTSGTTETAAVALYNFISYVQVNWAPLCAAGNILLVPIVVLAIFFQRSIVSGLSAGAVKA